MIHNQEDEGRRFSHHSWKKKLEAVRLFFILLNKQQKKLFGKRSKSLHKTYHHKSADSGQRTREKAAVSLGEGSARQHIFAGMFAACCCRRTISTFRRS
jgi:hypothetical protein